MANTSTSTYFLGFPNISPPLPIQFPYNTIRLSVCIQWSDSLCSVPLKQNLNGNHIVGSIFGDMFPAKPCKEHFAAWQRIG
jgi:hypothetical protein